MGLDTLFISLFLVACGWYVARENGRDALAKEKEVHRTLAIQALLANGMGRISKEELDVHHFVRQEIDDLVSLDGSMLTDRIGKLSINLGHWDEYRKERAS